MMIHSPTTARPPKNTGVEVNKGIDLTKVEQALSRALTDQYRQFGLEINARLVPRKEEEENEMANS